MDVLNTAFKYKVLTWVASGREYERSTNDVAPSPVPPITFVKSPLDDVL